MRTGRNRPNRLPDFLIIGQPRSATTWLKHCLAYHPEVWILKGELEWFCKNPDGHREEYAAHFHPGTARGDALCTIDQETVPDAAVARPLRQYSVMPELTIRRRIP